MTDLLEHLADSYNANLRRSEYAGVAADAFAGLSPEAVAKASEFLEPELLAQVRRGNADADELRTALTLRAEVAVEAVSTEKKRADLDEFDAELARHTPDEQLQKQYREELAASSDEQARVSPERIGARTERRLGLESSRAKAEEAEFDAELAKHSPSAEQLERETAFADAVAEKKEER